jgi:glutathione peroxidase
MNVTSLLWVALCAMPVACSSPIEEQHTETPTAPPPSSATGFYALSAVDIDGKHQALSRYAGKVALVVNTASQCGYTPQYEDLEHLYRELAPRGFVVLGWPSNDFGGQEPASDDDIKRFCIDKYHVTFPMFSKIVTKAGPQQSPIYATLGTATGKLPSWNFCKYLIAKDGTVLAFYPSKVSPGSNELREAIEAALAKS